MTDKRPISRPSRPIQILVGPETSYANTSIKIKDGGDSLDNCPEPVAPWMLHELVVIAVIYILPWR